MLWFTFISKFHQFKEQTKGSRYFSHSSKLITGQFRTGTHVFTNSVSLTLADSSGVAPCSSPVSLAVGTIAFRLEGAKPVDWKRC